MLEKDVRNENERRKNEEWDEYQERRIAKEIGVTISPFPI